MQAARSSSTVSPTLSFRECVLQNLCYPKTRCTRNLQNLTFFLQFCRHENRQLAPRNLPVNFHCQSCWCRIHGEAAGGRAGLYVCVVIRIVVLALGAGRAAWPGVLQSCPPCHELAEPSAARSVPRGSALCGAGTAPVPRCACRSCSARWQQLPLRLQRCSAGAGLWPLCGLHKVCSKWARSEDNKIKRNQCEKVVCCLRGV